MKTCTKCGQSKPLEAYSRQRLGRGGRRAACKVCTAAHQAAYEVASREKRRAYLDANRDAIAKRKRAHRLANREAISEQRRAHYEENRAVILERQRAYRAAHPHRLWAQGYRERARKHGHPIVIEDFTRDDVIERYGDACAHCGGDFEELDHYPIPVSRGGPHTLANVRPSCAACNQRTWRDQDAPRRTA